MLKFALFLVSLGTAAVLAHPNLESASIQNGNKTALEARSHVEELDDFETFLASIKLELQNEFNRNGNLIRKTAYLNDRSLADEWAKLKSAWNRLVDKAKAEIEELVLKGKLTIEALKEQLPAIEARITKLIDDLKRSYDKVALDGGELANKVGDLYDSLKEAYNRLKDLKAVKDFKDFTKKTLQIIELIKLSMTVAQTVG